MAQVTLDAKGVETYLTSGKIEQPPEVIADNAKTQKQPEGKEGKQPAADAKPNGADPGKAGPEDKPAATAEDDDVEGEDGLTPRQKREFTESMLKTIGKKHAKMMEAEEFATEQYNNRRLAEREAETLRRENERLKAQLQGQQPQSQPTDDKPKRENFQTDEAFRDALDDWRVDQKFKAREADAAKQREQERQQELLRTASERVTKAKELVPDYEEVVGGADIEVPAHVAGYMQESDLFAELGYHFAKHPAELERLRKLRPDKALVEIGKIESKLQPFGTASSNGAASKASSNGTQPSTETGTAPKSAAPSQPRATAPVITPLSTTSASSGDKPPQERSYEEERAAFQKRTGRNLMRRQRH